MLPVPFQDFYCRNSDYHDYNTRFKHSLTQPLYRTVLGHSQIRSTGVHFWNSLSTDIITSPTLNIFKRKKEKKISYKITMIIRRISLNFYNYG